MYNWIDTSEDVPNPECATTTELTVVSYSPAVNLIEPIFLFTAFLATF